MGPTKNGQKGLLNFHCELCDYHTSERSKYNRHKLTRKHKFLLNPTEKGQKSIVCNCGKSYRHTSTLYAHKKKCNFETHKLITTSNEDAYNNVIIPCEVFVELLKQNGEFKELMIEQNKQMIDLIGSGIGNTTNYHNNVKNKFNINIFLNEQCKDAMNIMDFVNTMQLQLSDLERVGELGYIKGISHIVVNKLKDLDVCKRPIHCSDLKRETMYVKDENVWEKEGDKNDKLSKMIKHLAHKNQKQIGDWQEVNPEYKDSESTKCDEYLKIVCESMTGLTNDEESETCMNKIIKNIAKEVIIKDSSVL